MINAIKKDRIKNLVISIWNALTFGFKLTLVVFVIITCICFWTFFVFYFASIGGDPTALSNSVILMLKIVALSICFVVVDKILHTFGVLK
jgi:hypothetical protein